MFKKEKKTLYLIIIVFFVNCSALKTKYQKINNKSIEKINEIFFR